MGRSGTEWFVFGCICTKDHVDRLPGTRAHVVLQGSAFYCSSDFMTSVTCHHCDCSQHMLFKFAR